MGRLKNLHRRHLNESQRALIAARVHASNPMGKGGNRRAVVPGQLRATDVAKGLNVSLSMLNKAKNVLQTAAPSTIRSIERGEARVGNKKSMVTIDFPHDEYARLRRHAASKNLSITEWARGLLRADASKAKAA